MVVVRLSGGVARRCYRWAKSTLINLGCRLEAVGSKPLHRAQGARDPKNLW